MGCTDGWSGKNCEIDIDDCASSPCKNDGVCTDQFADYSCECTDGWSGKNCKIDKDDCASSPCKNDGICIDQLADYSCKCPDGWSGKNCEIDIDDCASSPCNNGGSCTDQLADYSCKCPDGWSGKTCDDSTTTKPTTTTTTTSTEPTTTNYQSYLESKGYKLTKASTGGSCISPSKWDRNYLCMDHLEPLLFGCHDGTCFLQCKRGKQPWCYPQERDPENGLDWIGVRSCSNHQECEDNNLICRDKCSATRLESFESFNSNMQQSPSV